MGGPIRRHSLIPRARCGTRARRHQLSLFAHISKITWRLDRDDRIAGTISDSKNGEAGRATGQRPAAESGHPAQWVADRPLQPSQGLRTTRQSA